MCNEKFLGYGARRPTAIGACRPLSPRMPDDRSRSPTFTATRRTTARHVAGRPDTCPSSKCVRDSGDTCARRRATAIGACRSLSTRIPRDRSRSPTCTTRRRATARHVVRRPGRGPRAAACLCVGKSRRGGRRATAGIGRGLSRAAQRRTTTSAHQDTRRRAAATPGRAAATSRYLHRSPRRPLNGRPERESDGSNPPACLLFAPRKRRTAMRVHPPARATASRTRRGRHARSRHSRTPRGRPRGQANVYFKSLTASAHPTRPKHTRRPLGKVDRDTHTRFRTFTNCLSRNNNTVSPPPR